MSRLPSLERIATISLAPKIPHKAKGQSKGGANVGNALLDIRDGRLYREEFGTFEEYCQQRWKMSRIRAHQLIQATEIASDLLTDVNTPKPTNEFQLRPLAKL
jgi:hypothetical protein